MAVTLSANGIIYSDATTQVTAVGPVGSQSFSAPAAVGATTPAGGAFTTLSASGTVSGAGFTNYLASPPAIGGTTAAAGAFTTLTSQGSAVLTSANYNNAVVGGSATLTAGQRYFFNAAAQTATLPASPAVGTVVTVGVQSGDVTSVVARNGQNIMGIAQDMTINLGNASVTLEYVDATIGWRII